MNIETQIDIQGRKQSINSASETNMQVISFEADL